MGALLFDKMKYAAMIGISEGCCAGAYKKGMAVGIKRRRGSVWWSWCAIFLGGVVADLVITNPAQVNTDCVAMHNVS